MPMKVTSRTGADTYANPFVGPVGPTVAIDVNIANLTAYEVDAKGTIKPGIPLTRAGALLAAQTLSTVAQGTVTTGNADGVIGAATGGFGQPAETITATFTTSGATAHASVVGTKSGYIGELIVGTAFVSPQIRVSVADGSADFEAGDVITWAVTAGVDDKLFGVTVEAINLVADNSNTYRTGTFQIAVATAGLVNRDLVEDILGRVLTATEIAAFDHAAVRLTNT